MVQGICSQCGKMTEVSRCTECVTSIAINDSLQPSAYCSESCQENHWEHHKTACLARRQLRRASDLLVAIWLASREEAYGLPLSHVQKIDGNLHAYMGTFEYKQLLVRFPSDIVIDTLDKQALLSHNACVDALVYTFGLSKKVFEGMASRLDECY